MSIRRCIATVPLARADQVRLALAHLDRDAAVRVESERAPPAPPASPPRPVREMEVWFNEQRLNDVVGALIRNGATGVPGDVTIELDGEQPGSRLVLRS